MGIAVLASLGPLAARFFGRTRLRFPYLATAMSDARYAELSSKPGWAASQVQVAPGIRLRGLLRKPSDSHAPWVLFYPGNDASQLLMGQRFLSRLAGEQDWGLGVYAYRGYDSSDGKPELSALASDAPVTLKQFCAAQGIATNQVNVVGFSIGGHFAVHAVRGAAAAHTPAAGLTLLASVDDIVMVPPSRWLKLSPGDDYQTRPLLDGVPAPVLVVQGAADAALAGPGQGQAIAAALGARATYVERPGIGHEALLEDEDTLAKVRSFVVAQSKLAR
jgi:pimeloyl-ACP methyl ester carboxylesterase